MEAYTKDKNNNEKYQYLIKLIDKKEKSKKITNFIILFFTLLIVFFIIIQIFQKSNKQNELLYFGIFLNDTNNHASLQKINNNQYLVFKFESLRQAKEVLEIIHNNDIKAELKPIYKDSIISFDKAKKIIMK